MLTARPSVTVSRLTFTHGRVVLRRGGSRRMPSPAVTRAELPAVPHWVDTAETLAGVVFTLMDTVATLLSTTPLLTLNVKLSSPRNPGAGVYVRFGAVPVRDPCVGRDRTVNVSGRGGVFGSVAVRVMAAGASGATDRPWEKAVGKRATVR